MTSDIVQLQQNLNKPVVFVGLMGAGKTEMGQAFAKIMGWKCVDSDDVIIERAGMSIPEIFEKYGEPHFRELERQVVADLLAQEKTVISLGGGAVMQVQTAALVWEKSTSIWLNADLATLLDRTSRDDNRPLLRDGDPREILSELLEKRSPVYSKASITVDSNGSQDVVLNNIIQGLKAHLKL
ncbi:MAG: shikimate kinase [Pseudomonadota bacterium]